MAKRGSAAWRAKISKGKRNSRAADPEGWADKFARMVRTRKERGSLGLVVRGGNGKGPTRAQALLHELVGGELEFIIPLGKVGWKKGWPCCYSLDIGFVDERLGIDLDGESHHNPKSRKVDRLKKSRLKRLGWTLIRFWNADVLADPLRVSTIIKSMLKERSGKRAA